MKLSHIAVIIPCYRCTDTLPQAVQSVLDGAPSDLQLLLVEDGSPDATGTLCDTLAAGDPRITALHRPNGGASAARNTGLEHTDDAEWVMFVDCDDALLPGLWTELAVSDPAPGCGALLFGYRCDSGATSAGQLPSGNFADLASLGAALSPLLFEVGILASPCMKLYRRSDIGSLRFDESLQINEDVLFNLQFLQKNSAIYCLNGVYYNQHDLILGSLSRRLRGDLLQAERKTRPQLEKLLQQNGIEPASYTQKSRVRACINQYGLLTGRKGTMPFARRRVLFAEILADEDARCTLLAVLRSDPNRLLALPYRLGVSCRFPGFLAAYTQFKQHFL